MVTTAATQHEDSDLQSVFSRKKRILDNSILFFFYFFKDRQYKEDFFKSEESFKKLMITSRYDSLKLFFLGT